MVVRWGFGLAHASLLLHERGNVSSAWDDVFTTSRLEMQLSVSCPGPMMERVSSPCPAPCSRRSIQQSVSQSAGAAPSNLGPRLPGSFLLLVQTLPAYIDCVCIRADCTLLTHLFPFLPGSQCAQLCAEGEQSWPVNGRVELAALSSPPPLHACIEDASPSST